MPFLTDGGPQEMVEHSVEEEEQPENRLMADVSLPISRMRVVRVLRITVHISCHHNKGIMPRMVLLDF